VEEAEMGWAEFMSFLNLAFSVAFKTKSELLLEEDKHDFISSEAITMSIAVSYYMDELLQTRNIPCHNDYIFLVWVTNTN
jgi:hypothetical protein